LLSQADAGALLNVSERSVEHAVKVRREGIPEVFEACRSGVLPVSFAAELTGEAPEFQTAVIEKVRAGTRPTSQAGPLDLSGRPRRVTRMVTSSVVAARDRGDPIRCARLAKGWSQHELARRSVVSSAMVSQLEGRADRRVRVDSAEKIAGALGAVLDELFTFELPDAEPGERTRPATPPSKRYDGTAAKAKTETWRHYLEKVGDSTEPETCTWQGPLSLVRAAERFGLNAPRLSEAAQAKRVRARKLKRAGTVRGFEWQFDERELAADLAALPRCTWEECDRPDLNGTGACGEHGQKLWAQGARGTKRPPELVEKTAAAKRGKPRPDAAERMSRRHAAVNAEVKRKKDEAEEDLVTIADIAVNRGVTHHAVVAGYPQHGLKPVVDRVAGQRLLLFRSRDVDEASWQRRGETGRRAWRIGEGYAIVIAGVGSGATRSKWAGTWKLVEVRDPSAKGKEAALELAPVAIEKVQTYRALNRDVRRVIIEILMRDFVGAVLVDGAGHPIRRGRKDGEPKSVLFEDDRTTRRSREDPIYRRGRAIIMRRLARAQELRPSLELAFLLGEATSVQNCTDVAPATARM